MTSPTVHQFTPIIRDEDAIGNEAFALHQMFRQLGFNSRIYASRATTIRGATVHRHLPRFHRDDILVIHYSHWSEDLPRLLDSKCRKVLLYHNVTPDTYFKGEHPALREASFRARAELPRLRGTVDYAVAHSAFSAAELQDAGYDRVCKIPYLVWEPSYASADPGIIALRPVRSERTLLSVGRIAPHKRLELALLTLDYLVRYVDPRWRLMLVGRCEEFPVHYLQLRDLAGQLPSDRIVFSGHVPQTGLVGYYQIADAFICTSDHEGFGVPLVEAMRFDLPVFARETSAVPEIVADAGVLFPADADIPVMAETIDRVMRDGELQLDVIDRQRRRLRIMRPEQVIQQWQDLISSRFTAPDRAAGVTGDLDRESELTQVSNCQRREVGGIGEIRG